MNLYPTIIGNWRVNQQMGTLFFKSNKIILFQNGASVVVQWGKLLPVMLASHMSANLNPSCFAPSPASYNATVEAAEGDQRSWVPATYVADLIEIPGYWLQPSLTWPLWLAGEEWRLKQ